MKIRVDDWPTVRKIEHGPRSQGPSFQLDPGRFPVKVETASPTGLTRSGTDSGDFTDLSEHVDLCPVGGGGTRWYLCRRHPEALVFQAGSGRLDSVANSCPVCGNLSPAFTGCTCQFAAHPLDRATRPGRRIRKTDAAEGRNEA